MEVRRGDGVEGLEKWMKGKQGDRWAGAGLKKGEGRKSVEVGHSDSVFTQNIVMLPSETFFNRWIFVFFSDF